MAIDYSDLISTMKSSALASWAERLPEQIAAGLSHQRYGDLATWIKEGLESLPDITPSAYELKTAVQVGSREDLNNAQFQQLEQSLRTLMPWRKGPYTIFGLHIDTEWRSDHKWDRLLPHISNLKGKRILDVGCGNGYHCWRMLGEEAKQVIGIDPSPRFIVQFFALQKYLNLSSIGILPVGIQDVPENLQYFDTTFSMGVLYHRRSPMDHLRQLRDTLKPGGELILETLIIDGKLGEVLVPEDRYAKMNNVWFIPSVESLNLWLRKSGFTNVRCVDTCPTTLDEQRKTSWVNTQSLDDFLDPNDPSRTVEGYPAPLRGIFIANRK